MFSPQEIDRLASLARLEFGEREKESLAREIVAILDYVGELKRASAGTRSGTQEETFSILKNVFRADGEPHPPGVYQPEGYLKVKKILP